ncbi:hypothetical protein I4U23_030807 [Adineta vaga]|nr:hypothetical protein I4U23_030807 [Adineta vaga]
MEEEHSVNNNNNNENIPITSDSRHLQIRRSVLRQTNASRSSPYDSTLSSIEQRRRRQETSHSINNLITNLENPIENNISSIEQEQIEFIHENDEYEVLLEYTDTVSVDEIHTENDILNQEQDASYQSLSTIDSDPNDDDENHSRFYYTSTAIPVFEYSSSTESIEIILESSQNTSLPPTPRQRRSILPSNIRTNRGLRSSDIFNIPQKPYSSLKEQFDDNYSSILINTQCYICLEDFQSIDSIKILNCQHVFHSECINEWLRQHSTCAYCRTPVLIDLLRSTTGRRQRTRTRQHNPPLLRSSINHPTQQTSSPESSILEQE